jgi:hypothetical protein
MKSLRLSIALFLPMALLAAPWQQTSPGQTSTTQKKKDVPDQQSPGTENPDIGNHNPEGSTTASPSSVKHRKKHHPKSAGTTQTTATH